MIRPIANLFIFLLLTPALLSAADYSKKNPELMIFTEEYPPYTFTNDKGIVTGSTAQKVQNLFKQLNIPFKTKILPWKRAVFEQKRTERSFIYPLTRNQLREEQYQWVVPLDTLYLRLYGLSKYFKPDDEVVDGDYTFSCYDESSYCQILEKFGVKKSSIMTITIDDTAKQFELVLRERTHFMITTEEVFYHYLDKMNIDPKLFTQLNKYQYEITDYLAANKKLDPEIVKKVQQEAQ
jgi:polar amino acid transport system substrate-binding protein